MFMKKLLAIVVLGLLWNNPILSADKPTEEIRLMCYNKKINTTEPVSFLKIKGIWHAREGNVVYDPTLKKDQFGGTSKVKVTEDSLEIYYISSKYESWHTYSRISGERIQKLIMNGITSYFSATCEKASRKF